MRVLTSTRSKGLLTKSLAPGLQGPQFVTGLCGDHQDGQVIVRIAGLQRFDHLESIHAGHLQVEQDQVVAVLAMQCADLLRIHRRGKVGVTGFKQHLPDEAR